MKSLKLILVLSLVCASPSVLACQQDEMASGSTNTVEPCDNTLDSSVADKPILPQIHVVDKEEPDYWAQWDDDIAASPMVSAGNDLSHFGLSVWQPNDEETVAEMEYSEWVMSHGLQLSLGLGEADKPKIRLDYEWHDMMDDKVILQVEVPF